MPPGWDNILRHTLANPAVLATAFKFEVNRMQMSGKKPVGLTFLEIATSLRASRFMLPLGDQVRVGCSELCDGLLTVRVCAAAGRASR